MRRTLVLSEHYSAKKLSMFIYNITSKVEYAIHNEWLQWQKQFHIPAIMQTGCFTKFQVNRLLETNDEEGFTYTIQYFANTKEDYEKYINEFAPQMRKDVIEKWGNNFIAFRTLMQVVH